MTRCASARARRRRPAIRLRRWRSAARDYRGDQTGLAEQGRHPARTRSGERRGYLRRRRRRRDFGIDRRSLQRFARRSAGRAWRGRFALAAQGLHLRPLPNLRGPRGRGGLYPADSRDARAGAGARAQDLAIELGMAVLVEVHNRAELESAQAIGARLIGINNRDLHTFHTDIAVTEELLAAYRGDALIVSESGIEYAGGYPAPVCRRCACVSDRREPVARRRSSHRLRALTGALGGESAAGGRVG